MQNRQNALKQWLQNTLKTDQIILTPLNGDASFRCYYRLQNVNAHYIVMDAPPEKETLTSFLLIGQLLHQHKILTPRVHAFDEQLGFALLDDFGDTLLLTKIRDPQLTTQAVSNLYTKALTTLNHMQHCPVNTYPPIPIFNQEHMQSELDLFTTWFLDGYLGLQLSAPEIQLIEKTTHWLVKEISQQPYVFIHRDYHSRNIMVLDDSRLGIIDFQDAMSGPLTYDLVSLLKDCYIHLSNAHITQSLNFFYHQSTTAQQLSFAEFKRAFDLCGLQRHLKVLGIFSRLFLRDGKSGYLADLPLTRHYVIECLNNYPELHSFYHFMEQRAQLPGIPA